MFCSTCGNSLKTGAKFCARCGERQAAQSVPIIVVQENATPVFEAVDIVQAPAAESELALVGAGLVIEEAIAGDLPALGFDHSSGGDILDYDAFAEDVLVEEILSEPNSVAELLEEVTLPDVSAQVRCTSGHPVSSTDKFCRECGESSAAFGVSFSSSPAAVAPLDTEAQRIADGILYGDMAAQAPAPAPAAVAATVAPEAPVAVTTPKTLKTNRSTVAYFFLGLFTFEIYSIYMWYNCVKSLNIVAERDGKRTTNFLLMILLTICTLGLYYFIWNHNFTKRIHDEQKRRNLHASVAPRDFWIWDVFLAPALLIGPYIYAHKVFNAMNALCADYNSRGLVEQSALAPVVNVSVTVNN